ncbi:MAG: tripartite tricarboxylate transporter substrate binding protein [Burkholderiales bacterium]|nr:tripartite tricarboxylate transporter substrate binding protein [Burkholderiales bacterium]
MKTASSTVVALVCAGLFAAPAVHAQGGFPSKPMRMIVAFAPGGSGDLFGRLVAQHLGQAMKFPVVVENRVGATGTIATAAAAKAPADGYTMLMATSSSHYSAYLYKSVPYDVERDLAPLINLAVVPLFVVANPNFPPNNVRELIDYVKKNPGKVTYSSPGSGGLAHLGTEMFSSVAGIKMLHVPYKGAAPAVAEVVAGRIDLIFDSVSTTGPHVKSGKLKAIAIAGAKRAAGAPDVPTIAESGLPGFEATYWLGLFAPARTPAPALRTLNAEIAKFMHTPEMSKRVLDMGGYVAADSPEDFAAYLKRDSARWVKVIKEVGITLD